MGITTHVCQTTVSSAINITQGNVLSLGCSNFFRSDIFKHIRLDVDFYIAINSAWGITTTKHIATFLDSALAHLRVELTLNAKVYGILSTHAKQIASLMQYTWIRHYVISHITATHNLIGDDKICREVIVHYSAIFIRLNIHVTTVTTTIEWADSNITSWPWYLWLNIHLNRLEIKVEKMRINLRSVRMSHWQILQTDCMVTRFINPVNLVLKVKRVKILVCLTVFLTTVKHSLTITTHEGILDFQITIEFNLHWRFILSINTTNCGRVSTTEHTTKHKRIFFRIPLQIDFHILHLWTVRTTVYHSLCRSRGSNTGHELTRRNGINKVVCILSNLIVLVHGHLLLLVSTYGIEIVTVTCTIHITIHMTCRNVESGFGEYITRHIITTIHIFVNPDRLAIIACISTNVKGYSASLFGSKSWAILRFIRKAHIAHQTTTEDVIAVNPFNIYFNSTNRGIEATTKHTTKEGLTSDIHMGCSSYYAWISTTNDIHHRLTSVEMSMKYRKIRNERSILNEFSIFGYSILHKMHVDVRIMLNDGIFTISTTQDTEVRWTCLVIYLRPLVGIKEATCLRGTYARDHFTVTQQHTLWHINIRITFNDTCRATATIDIMVHGELLHSRIILRRVE